MTEAHVLMEELPLPYWVGHRLAISLLPRRKDELVVVPYIPQGFLCCELEGMKKLFIYVFSD